MLMIFACARPSLSVDEVKSLAPISPPPKTSVGAQLVTEAAQALAAAPISFTNRGATAVQVFHQPLVQVKLRVAQVVRDDTVQAASVLDYISHEGTPSLIKGNNVNENMQRTSAVTRFPQPVSLIGIEGSGHGALVNLTTYHLNFIARLLATEFNADLVTCPQVVTLNGQKVAFSSGDKVPFELGQSVLHDGTLANQAFFYKHVGTFVEITPRIVNWGAFGEGRGNKPATVADVHNWNKLTKLILKERLYEQSHYEPEPEDVERFQHYSRSNVLVRSADQRQLLHWINELTLNDLARFLEQRLALNPSYEFRFEEIFHSLGRVIVDAQGRPCDSCHWRPENCTVDVELVLRQSSRGTDSPSASPRSGSTDADRPALSASGEEIGAAVATVVQLKSGNGALIAGLIGERDVEEISKVPILGDVPIAGQLFRSKSVNRQKTETLVFLEVEVLHPDQHVKRAQASADFALGRAYVVGDVRENPLNAGLWRAGFGSYLPPRSLGEHVYWHRLGQKIRRGTTVLHDIIE